MSDLIQNFKTFQHCRDGIASRAILFLAADRLIHAHHRGNHMYTNQNCTSFLYNYPMCMLTDKCLNLYT